MTQLWPPTPSVEDEDVALAKEQVVGVPLDKIKSENQPAGSRGSVDQYPIILDHNGPDTDSTQTPPVHPKREPGSDGVDSSREEPANPPIGTNPEKRFILVPAEQSAVADNAFPQTLHRSKSFTQVKDYGMSRERPQVARINTDLGGVSHHLTLGTLQRLCRLQHFLKQQPISSPLRTLINPEDHSLSIRHTVQHPVTAVIPSIRQAQGGNTSAVGAEHLDKVSITLTALRRKNRRALRSAGEDPAGEKASLVMISVTTALLHHKMGSLVTVIHRRSI
ncbi:hypothetical protein LTR10_017269 [Elasticomyces elasticus]|uniref:Uncharacterized protein n=1 Tax=Exophiala sideris TaxID=1016849 RepID=A0ABR0JJF9_9EURO|nr:hypothetical protein LTR10_017269 [Elasticomyces elasticus]KAK5034171.1 hypothetical protein LTS07_003091 [Exophiala sideris]KAK5042467.1 hypothetical protein LTR13_001314 [Exophiala sideris]KAK5065549.1 hypothetical protein LTR69_003098 [Exophiala sideris]KAK5185993.1 hypothetical protein LTR44_002042 [Eurotiomycetes sp. CCFEE 6388]